ncbi:cytochrome b5-like heme steroid binding domain-containing protein [Colletotrichum incanum]|uniref:Cytochrome b5-like heme steroid binding domain-containing protein n=1 Tax=Colletotrichum incanum TaxID=1573173 RepID=A0A161WJI3_COLIC|nr:cytochrome b5-like heme steroid binding domain-containing protein [Colletotrichum incanum]
MINPALQDSDECSKYIDLIEQLSPYLGTDATLDLKTEEGEEAPLLQFARLKGYIVATIEKIGQGLPEIEFEELQTFDGHVDEIQNLQHDSFVASLEMVYDLTAAMQFGSLNPNYAKFKPFLGGVVTDEQLKTYLLNNCDGLICAVLVKKKQPGGGGGRVVNWDSKRQVPPHYKMPIWISRPMRQKSPPAEDEIAPHSSTIQRAQTGLQEGDFKKKDIFEPLPSQNYLNTLMANMKYRARPDTREKSGRNYISTRTLSSVPKPAPEQFARLKSEFRRRKDDKKVKMRKVTSVDAIYIDPVRGVNVLQPTSQPASNTKQSQKFRTLAEKISVAGDAEHSTIEKWMALEPILKRKPRFEVDDRQTKMQR